MYTSNVDASRSICERRRVTAFFGHPAGLRDARRRMQIKLSADQTADVMSRHGDRI
jgi:hypothetical protein